VHDFFTQGKKVELRKEALQEIFPCLVECFEVNKLGMVAKKRVRNHFG